MSQRDSPAPTALRELVARARRPDATEADEAALRRAVEALFLESHDRIYRYCCHLLRDPSRAADLTQETFLTAWRRLDSYEGNGSFHGWLHGVARNLCLHANARPGELLEDEVFEPTDPSRSALSELRSHERRALVQEACRAALDPVEQEAVVMRYELGLPVEEITAALHLRDASGARGLLQTCRRKLQRELARRLEALGARRSVLQDSG